LLQPGDQTKNPGLLGVPQVVLESHQIVARGTQILLSQLHDGVGPAAGARIHQAHGLHGAEAQSLAAAADQLLHGQAGFEAGNVAGDVRLMALRFEQGVDEAFILGPVERTVEVIAGGVDGLAIAGGTEHDGEVNRAGVDDGADAVEEVEPLGTGQPRDLGRQRVACEGARGNDHDRAARKRGQFLPPDLNARVAFDGRAHFGGKNLAIHGERLASRHASGGGRSKQERSEPSKFLLEEPGRAGNLFAFQRVAANQLGEPIGLVSGGGAGRPHLVQFDSEAGLRDLPGSLRSRQTAADDVDDLRVHAHFLVSSRSGALRSGAGDFARAQKGVDAKGPHHGDEEEVDRHARESLPRLVKLLPLTKGSGERDQSQA